MNKPWTLTSQLEACRAINRDLLAALRALERRVTEYHGYEEDGSDPLSAAVLGARAALAKVGGR